MENSNPILNELKEISPVIAAIGSRTPYAVPNAYFDNLPMLVLLRIAAEEKAGIDPVLTISKENIYELPAGYFEGLAGNILHQIKARELENPQEELSLLSPLLSSISKKNPFESPEGYFNESSENIVAGVKAIEFVNEELENLSPVMAGLKGKQVYEVPGDYFENNAAILLHKARQQQPARVMSLFPVKKIMRYAAAAVVTGIIALSVYVIAGKSSTTDRPLADVKTALDSANVARIPDQEMESFLNTTGISLADVTAVSADDAADDPKDLLADVSDEELQQYLEQQGGTINAVIN